MSERPTAEEERQSQESLRTNDTPESNDGETRDDVLGGIDRRQYLKLGAATAVGAVGFSGRSTAETREGISFDRVVDAVDDLGMDPNGNEAIDDKLDDAWGPGTLIEFPAGEYLVTGPRNYSHDTSNAGIVGKTGDRSDVEFVFPDGYNDRFLNVRFGSDLLFGDFTIQQTDDWETSVGCAFAPDGDATIRNLEIAGNNPRGKQRGLALTVYDSDGVMNLDGFVRTGESGVGDYPSGTQALLVPSEHEGVVYIRDAHIANAGENGIYGSHCPGDVRIEGGHFENNDIASVRIAGDGSYVKDATFVVDTEGHDNHGSYDNLRGLWMETGPGNYSGGLVENCNFILRSASNSGGLLRIAGDAGDVTVRGCRFRNETRFATLFAESGGDSIRVENCSVTGGASNARRGAVELVDRNGSMVSDCCISMDGSQNGVVIRGSSGCTVRRSTVDVNNKAIYTPGSSVATSGISHSGSCPLPGDGGDDAGGDVGGSRGDSSDDGSSSSDSSSDDSSSDDSSSDESGDDGSSDDGSSDDGSSDDKSSSSSDESSDDKSSSSSDESSSGGESSSGSDESNDGSEKSSSSSDESSGSSDGGDSDDGGNADAGTQSTSPSPRDARTLKLTSDDVSPYEFSVSGNVDFYPAFGTEDRIDGSTVHGVLAGGTDVYRFDGDISSFTIEGSPTVELDGEPVDPSALGDSKESMSNVLLLESKDHAPYDIEVSGDIALDPRYGTEDATSGDTATGLLAGGTDVYRFSGDITKFEVDGHVDVLLNGESVDQSELAN